MSAARSVASTYISLKRAQESPVKARRSWSAWRVCGETVCYGVAVCFNPTRMREFEEECESVIAIVVLTRWRRVAVSPFASGWSSLYYSLFAF